MKKLINVSKGANLKKAYSSLQFKGLDWLTRSFLLMILFSTVLFAGCQKENSSLPANEDRLMSQHGMDTDQEFRNYYSGLDKQTVWELQQARAATAKYRHIEKAIADGYADINVVRQNMGYHFMKVGNVDINFDLKKPEILVYEKLDDGSFRLVAVEYAVPIPLTPNAAPAGFSGSADVWTKSAEFNLWLLHAWVWKNNPDGVFKSMNPLVTVDPDEIH